MNTVDLTIRDLSRTLRNLTAEPLVSDYLEWARDTNTFRHVEWSLSTYGIGFERTEPLADLRARLENWLVGDARRRDRKHWSFDPVRRGGVKEILATIEQYQESK
jgi:hypothetical protein